MVPTPNYLKAASVTNKCAHAITAKLTHKHDGHDTVKSAVIQPGETHAFEEVDVNMGSWTAVAPVHEIRVEAEGKDAVLHTPAVQGVVGRMEFVVSGEGALSVSQA